MFPEFIHNLSVICENHNEKNYLLAVSGGIDSVVMSHLFKSAGLHIAIAHCNFGLRGDESEGDQRFVEVLAKQLRARLHIRKFDTLKYAGENGISIQMAARELRYAWFRELAKEFNYDWITVAHNKDDLVETVLLNLTRGTGIRGMTGMKARNNMILRPLLFAGRDMISKYASDYKLLWREDSSNKETKYLRNKIRHVIIPAFRQINPSFLDSVTDTAERFEQAGRLLDHSISKIKEQVWKELPDRILIDLNKLKEFGESSYILYELLRDFGVTHTSEKTLSRLTCALSGKHIHTGTYTITTDRDHLIVMPSAEKVFPHIDINEGTDIIEFPVKLKFKAVEKTAGFKLPSEKYIAALDADCLKFPLKLRPWKQGDRFYPLGLKGSKKISDYLINHKIPLPDKQHVWVLESEEKIAWLVNYRLDDRFKITPGTNRILLIEYGE